MESGKKKSLILAAIGALTLIITTIGAAYAYFVAMAGEGMSGTVNATSGTTDSLMFDVGSRIDIYATTETFAQGAGNLSESTTAKAVLKANNDTNYAKYNYYLYLDVSANGFVYTTEEKTAELLLTITDKEGTPLTSVEGLNYVTVGGVSGFDITVAKGTIPLLDNYEIETTSELTQEWNITVTLVNLSNNQKQNLNKNYIAEIKIQSDVLRNEPLTAQEFIAAKFTKQGDGGLYYHNGEILTEDGTVLDAEDKSYRYSGANPNNYVCFGSTEVTCPTDNLYRIIGIFDVNEDNDNPNYQMKLIKADYANSTLLGTDGGYNTTEIHSDTYKGNQSALYRYYWASKSNKSNVWIGSTLNTTNLNINYLNNIGTEWSNLIVTHSWQVGGMTGANGISIPKTVYNYEVGVNKADTTYDAKIGLMYASDYGYAASPENWTAGLGNYHNTTSTSNNWLYLGENEWTISRTSDSSENASLVLMSGYVGQHRAGDFSYGVRPTFYLDSSVKILGGYGTAADPYRIEM